MAQELRASQPAGRMGVPRHRVCGPGRDRRPRETPMTRKRSGLQCSTDECPNDGYGPGNFCGSCRHRIRRYGSVANRPRPMNAMTRIMRQVHVGSQMGACWEWMGGCTNGAGYGRSYVGSHSGGDFHHVYVHRFVYEYFHGPIPDGMHVDHLCFNRACCNPDHLEAVSPAVNMSRAWARRRAMASQAVAP